MSKDSKKKKLVLGSALAGLMIAGSGLSVTATPTDGSSGKFFQTAELKVGYRLAQAGEGPGDTGDKGTVEQDEEEKAEEQAEEAQEEKAEGEKKCGGDKKCGAGSCG